MDKDIAPRLESIVAGMSSTLDEMDTGDIDNETATMILRIYVDGIDNLRERIELRMATPEDLPF